MTSQPVANDTSTGSHGGGFVVKTTSTAGSAAMGTFAMNTVPFNGAGASGPLPGGLTDNAHKVLRVGDTYLCPTHGPNPIVTGSNVWTDDGRPIVRQGDATACGATVQPPVSPEWSSE